MKSVISSAIVATILLTGEWASDLLARNSIVILMIVCAGGAWAWIGYKSPAPEKNDEPGNQQQL